MFLLLVKVLKIGSMDLNVVLFLEECLEWLLKLMGKIIFFINVVLMLWLLIWIWVRFGIYLFRDEVYVIE